MDIGRTKIILAEPHSQQSGTHGALESASHATPLGCLPISTHLRALRRELWRPKPLLRRPKIASSSLSLPSLTNPIPTKLHLPPTSLPSLPRRRWRRRSTPAAARHHGGGGGSTGYIGNFVVRVLVLRGFNVVAVATTPAPTPSPSSPAPHSLRRLDRPASLAAAFPPSVDVIVSCLASRSGGVRDSFLVDYQATANSLAAGRASGADHFVLLSAFCVQKPLLAFQRAKPKLESELAVTAADPLEQKGDAVPAAGQGAQVREGADRGHGLGDEARAGGGVREDRAVLCGGELAGLGSGDGGEGVHGEGD